MVGTSYMREDTRNYHKTLNGKSHFIFCIIHTVHIYIEYNIYNYIEYKNTKGANSKCLLFYPASKAKELFVCR
jgi:hypothetical protein